MSSGDVSPCFSVKVLGVVSQKDFPFSSYSWGGVRIEVHLLHRPVASEEDGDDFGEVCGVTISRRKRSTGENLPQCHFFHHKPHVT
jgi:hypothetical protein